MGLWIAFIMTFELWANFGCNCHQWGQKTTNQYALCLARGLFGSWYSLFSTSMTNVCTQINQQGVQQSTNTYKALMRPFFSSDEKSAKISYFCIANSNSKEIFWSLVLVTLRVHFHDCLLIVILYSIDWYCSSVTFSQGRFLIYKKRRSLERQTKVPHIEEQKDVVATILRSCTCYWSSDRIWQQIQ